MKLITDPALDVAHDLIGAGRGGERASPLLDFLQSRPPGGEARDRVLHRVFQREPEGHGVVRLEELAHDAYRQGQKLFHPRADSLPHVGSLADETRQHEQPVGQVALLVGLRAREPRAEAREPIAAREGGIEGVISCVTEHALADQAVDHDRVRLSCRSRVDQEALHGGRESFGKEATEAGRLIALQVARLAADRVEDAAKELDVLGLVGEEGREKQLFLEPLFAGHGHEEREEVAGHALFRRLEQHAEPEEHVPLGDAEPGPILGVARQVQGLRVPSAEALCLVVQPHRHGVVTQCAGAGRPHLCHGGAIAPRSPCRRSGGTWRRPSRRRSPPAPRS